MELIGELAPPTDWATTRHEIRSPVACCAWSQEKSFLAWNCGNNVVCVVKIIYNADQSLLISPTCTLNAKDLVFSLAFGQPLGQPECHQPVLFKAKPKFLYHHFVDILLAVGLSTGRIRTYDAETGCAKLELIDHRLTISHLDFSKQDGFRLLSSSFDSTLKIWDMDDDGNMTTTIRTPFSKVYSCAWSSNDSMIVAVGDKKHVFIWSGVTYQLLFKIPGHLNTISQCQFSSDSSLLVSSSFDTRVVIWDLNTLLPLTTLHHLVPQPSFIFCGGTNGNYVFSVSLSRCNQYVATVDEKKILRLWNIDYPEEPLFKYYSKFDGSCKFSPNGKYLAFVRIDGYVLLFKILDIDVPSLQNICRQFIRSQYTSPQIAAFTGFPKRLINYLLYLHRDFHKDIVS